MPGYGRLNQCIAIILEVCSLKWSLEIYGGAVTKPRAWPAFRYEGVELRKALDLIQEWDVQVVNSKVNRCAHAIARSVTREKKYQSYVAQVSPRWLKEMFEEDQQGV